MNPNPDRKTRQRKLRPHLLVLVVLALGARVSAQTGGPTT
jgi:hypothetical protein